MDGVRCPSCCSGSVIRHGRLHYQREFYRYLCKVCGRTFNDETGALLHYSRLRIDEFAPEAILHLHMSVSSVSKLMCVSYRYCYMFYTRFIHRLSISAASMDGVVEVDEVHVAAVLNGGRRMGLGGGVGRDMRGIGYLSWLLFLGMDVRVTLL